MDDDKLNEMGRAVGMAIQARIAANRPAEPRFPERGTRLPADWGTSFDLACDGYRRFLRAAEQREMDYARQRIAENREYVRRNFMQRVETALETETDPAIRSLLQFELAKVRRALRLDKPSAETIRAQTRERVRRHRAGKKRCELRRLKPHQRKL
jgi:hypothetical protein